MNNPTSLKPRHLRQIRSRQQPCLHGDCRAEGLITGNMRQGLHHIDLWKKQSELFWRTVYSMPFIGIAVFAGWYTLESKKEFLLSQYLLGAGILIMLLQMAVLRRMAQYLNAFKAAAGNLMPDIPAPRLGLTGNRIGVITPAILITLFAIMLFMDMGSRPDERTEERPRDQKTTALDVAGSGDEAIRI